MVTPLIGGPLPVVSSHAAPHEVTSQAGSQVQAVAAAAAANATGLQGALQAGPNGINAKVTANKAREDRKADTRGADKAGHKQGDDDLDLTDNDSPTGHMINKLV